MTGGVGGGGGRGHLQPAFCLLGLDLHRSLLPLKQMLPLTPPHRPTFQEVLAALGELRDAEGGTTPQVQVHSYA